MAFAKSDMFGDINYTEEQLAAFAKSLNEQSDINLINKHLQKQMKEERNIEKGFILNNLNTLNKELEELKIKYNYYESKLEKEINIDLLERYETKLFDVANKIREKEQEISDITKDIS